MLRFCCALAVVLSTTVARAADGVTEGDSVVVPAHPAGPWAARPWTLELEVGLATPVGGFGVCFDRTMGNAFTLSLGVGTNGYGVEGAFMARARFFASSPSFYVGAGVSGGNYVQTKGMQGALALFFRGFEANDHSGVSIDYRWKVAYWANLEMGADFRSKDRAGTVRYFGGLALLLSPTPSSASWRQGSETREGVSSEYPVQAVLLYGGLALGTSW